MSLPAKFPRTPILCYVTDRKSLGSQGVGDNRTELLHCIVAAAGAGVDWIQIREKDLSGKEISLLVRDSLTLAKSSNPPNGQCTRILVNDRLDVAFAEQAGGVHLGENSLPLRNVSTWLGSPSKRPALLDFLVGVSCHSVENALDAARHGADYVFWSRVCHTIKDGVRRAARPGPPARGLQRNDAASIGHRRNHSGKRALVPRSRCRGHRRYPPFSGLWRSAVGTDTPEGVTEKSPQPRTITDYLPIGITWGSTR